MFHKFLQSAVKNLGNLSEKANNRKGFKSSDHVDIALLKYKNHPSIFKIKEFVGKIYQNSISLK